MCFFKKSISVSFKKNFQSRRQVHTTATTTTLQGENVNSESLIESEELFSLDTLTVLIDYEQLSALMIISVVHLSILQDLLSPNELELYRSIFHFWRNSWLNPEFDLTYNITRGIFLFRNPYCLMFCTTLHHSLLSSLLNLTLEVMPSEQIPTYFRQEFLNAVTTNIDRAAVSFQEFDNGISYPLQSNPSFCLNHIVIYPNGISSFDSDVISPNISWFNIKFLLKVAPVVFVTASVLTGGGIPSNLLML